MYRSRIGQFTQRVFGRKYLFKREFYYKYWDGDGDGDSNSNSNRMGKLVFDVTKSIFKISLLLVLLSGCLGHASCQSEHSGPGHVHAVRGEARDGVGDWLAQQLCFTRVGKRSTNNFQARYLYGNKIQKGIHNFHLNIRSLKNKVFEIKNIVKEHSPHILGLSECELKKENVDENNLKVPGYNILYPKSWNVHGFARVVIYVKKTFNYEQIFDLEDDLVQSIWLRGSFKNSKKLYFCHAYREHLSEHPVSYQKEYLGKFLSQWEAATDHNFPLEPNEVHVSLDMNLDAYNGRWLQADYKLVSLARLVLSACNVSNFTQLVKEPTRLMYNSVTKTTEISCIDHIYCNAKYKCSSPIVISCGASDHDMITYTRYSKDPPVPARTIRKRSYKAFIPEDFISDISAVDWSVVFACRDVDLAVDIFTRKFCQVLDTHAPWIIFQQRKHFSPWITDDLKELMKQREFYKEKAKYLASISPSHVTEEQTEAWEKFKFFRNKVNNKKQAWGRQCQTPISTLNLYVDFETFT